MNLIRWRNDLTDPFRGFESLQTEINRLFDTTRGPESRSLTDGRGLFDRAYSPAVDIAENPDNYEVTCDLPGLDIKEIELSVADNVFTIKGERKKGDKSRENSVFLEELSSGRFQRTLSFPLPVNPDKVEAVLTNGVLTVTLPKQEAVKPKQISVKAE